MKRPPRHPALDRLHHYTQTKRTTHQPPTLSEPSAGETMDRAAHYPVGHFGPQHGLTPAQAWDAQQLLNRANRRRPLRGPDAQARFALRMAGIIAAVKGGRVGNSAFGRKLHRHRGGKVMARHALRHLRTIAPLGNQAAAAKRQTQKVQQEGGDTPHRMGKRTGTILRTGETCVSWPEEWPG